MVYEICVGSWRLQTSVAQTWEEMTLVGETRSRAVGRAIAQGRPCNREAEASAP